MFSFFIIFKQKLSSKIKNVSVFRISVVTNVAKMESYWKSSDLNVKATFDKPNMLKGTTEL